MTDENYVANIPTYLGWVIEDTVRNINPILRSKLGIILTPTGTKDLRNNLFEIVYYRYHINLSYPENHNLLQVFYIRLVWISMWSCYAATWSIKIINK